MQNNNNYPLADIPGSIIFMAFVFYWPIGVVLAVLKSVQTTARQNAQNASGGVIETTTVTGTKYPSRGAGRTAARRAQAQKNVNAGGWEIPLTVIGILALIVGFTLAVESLSWLIGYGFFQSYLFDLLYSAGWLAGGFTSLAAAAKIRKNKRQLKKYKAIVGIKDNMAIADIAASMPTSFSDACKDLESAIDKGLFGPDAYLDMRTQTLVVRGPAPDAPKNEAPTKAQKQATAEAKTEYQLIIEQLRAVNEAIPGEDMTAKINRLEEVTAKIFDLVEKDPAKANQLRSFMDYYLPTALKLLNAYSEFDKPGISGENISAAKSRIEKTMDALVLGFERQLDQLFQNDMLDVSSDIQVLENMMSQDGLLNGDTFRMG